MIPSNESAGRMENLGRQFSIWACYCDKHSLPLSPNKVGLLLGMSATKGPCTSTISGAVINRALINKYKLLRVITTNFGPVAKPQIFASFCCDVGKLLKDDGKKKLDWDWVTTNLLHETSHFELLPNCRKWSSGSTFSSQQLLKLIKVDIRVMGNTINQILVLL